MSPVGDTGYDDWVNNLWLLFLPVALVVSAVAWLIDRIKRK
jgi:hypothetical protein